MILQDAFISFFSFRLLSTISSKRPYCQEVQQLCSVTKIRQFVFLNIYVLFKYGSIRAILL